MDLTLQSLVETRKQSLQSWVPIDFSGITCISKGFQDMTRCPISKTKWTWMRFHSAQKGAVYLPVIYSSYGIIPAYLFYIFFVFWPTEPHCYVKSTCPSSILSSFFTVSSDVRVNPCFHKAFFLCFCFLWWKKYFGLGTISHCMFLIN